MINGAQHSGPCEVPTKGEKIFYIKEMEVLKWWFMVMTHDKFGMWTKSNETKLMNSIPHTLPFFSPSLTVTLQLIYNPLLLIICVVTPQQHAGRMFIPCYYVVQLLIIVLAQLHTQVVFVLDASDGN